MRLAGHRISLVPARRVQAPHAQLAVLSRREQKVGAGADEGRERDDGAAMAGEVLQESERPVAAGTITPHGENAVLFGAALCMTHKGDTHHRSRDYQVRSIVAAGGDEGVGRVLVEQVAELREQHALAQPALVQSVAPRVRHALQHIQRHQQLQLAIRRHEHGIAIALLLLFLGSQFFPLFGLQVGSGCGSTHIQLVLLQSRLRLVQRYAFVAEAQLGRVARPEVRRRKSYALVVLFSNTIQIHLTGKHGRICGLHEGIEHE